MRISDSRRAMLCAYTLYWPTQTWDEYRRTGRNGQLLSHVAGDHLHQHEVAPGDALYVITLLEMDLLLIGKMIVGKVCGPEEAAACLDLSLEALGSTAPHAIAAACTPQSWSRVVPVPITYQLRFLTHTQEYGVFHRSYTVQDYLEQLQGINRLTLHSAALLDTLLPPLLPGPLAYP